jgi:hypothetical protein
MLGLQYSPGSMRGQLFSIHPQLGRRFFSAVVQETQTQEPADEFVVREATTARSEVVRDWLNSVQGAWKSWGRDAGHVRLRTGAIEPDLPSERSSASEAWVRLQERTRASLLASVAVDEDGIRQVLDLLRTAVGKRCAGGQSVPLPGGLSLSMNDGDLFVTRESDKGTVLSRPA